MEERNGRLAAGLVSELMMLNQIIASQLRAGARPAGELTLDPDQFEGDARLAHQAVQHQSAVLAQLHRYCTRERLQGGGNLLGCFRTDHAAECATCGEALDAVRMYEGGSPVEQIANVLRRQYGSGG
jgi:hypothetical protein